MKYAVIYARYSSDKQNDMSIEGQIAECRKFAEANDVVVLQEYIDRAQSATTDKRPSFLQMIDDSRERSFDTILVYQFDRFARNKNDSGYYKKILADNGVKVVSAKEQIASDSSGVITEGMLEIFAEYFSKQSAEKVVRGMRQNAEKCRYNGGTMTFGYSVDSEGYYILDPERAPIVKEIFERTAQGESGNSIIQDLTNRGVKNLKGKPLPKNAIYRMLKNEKYKGIYIFNDIRIPGGIPRIVSDELFDEVKAIVDQRAYKSGGRPANEDFLLTGKLFCGHCKSPMTGTSGTSRTGKIHRYYTCKNAPKKCDKKNVKKEFIEDLVFDKCRSMITDDVIDNVVKAIKTLNEKDQDGLELVRLNKELKETKAKIEKILDKIESGSDSPSLTERLSQREKEADILNRQIKLETAKQLKIEPETAKLFMKAMRRGDIEDPHYRKMLVRVFIDRIYLYDDHLHILLNYSDKKSQINDDNASVIEEYFDNNGSSIDNNGAPNRTYSNIYIYKGGFALKVWFEEV